MNQNGVCPTLKTAFCGVALLLHPARGGQEKRAAAKRLTLRKGPPTYVRNERDKSKRPGMVREGVDAGRGRAGRGRALS